MRKVLMTVGPNPGEPLDWGLLLVRDGDGPVEVWPELLPGPHRALAGYSDPATGKWYKVRPVQPMLPGRHRRPLALLKSVARESATLEEAAGEILERLGLGPESQRVGEYSRLFIAEWVGPGTSGYWDRPVPAIA